MESTSTRRTADQGIEHASSTAHKSVERAAQAASDVVDRFGEKAEEWLEMKDDWVDGAREYVREHPIAALGIAAAAGYLLSMIMRSR